MDLGGFNASPLSLISNYDWLCFTKASRCRFADEFPSDGLRTFLVEMIAAHVSECEEDALLQMIEHFTGPEEVLTHVKILKDDGNLLFKMGNV